MIVSSGIATIFFTCISVAFAFIIHQNVSDDGCNSQAVDALGPGKSANGNNAMMIIL